MNFDNGRPTMFDSLEWEKKTEVIDYDDVLCIPTMDEVIDVLRVIANNHGLFAEIPIGQSACVILVVTSELWEVQYSATDDGEGIDVPTGLGVYEAEDQIYLCDTDDELRACAHRMLSSIRDEIDSDLTFGDGIFSGKGQ